MFSHEVTQSKFDYFDHFLPSPIPNKITNNLISSTFLSPTPSTYSDSGSYQQSPMSIYNNYNPNYHHHHYYFPSSLQDYGYSQQQSGFYDNGSSWLRKFDTESQKEYFLASTPPMPSECCDFEVPQRAAQSPKPNEAKLFSDLDKIFFEDRNATKVKDHNNSNNSYDACSFWGSEKLCNEKTSKKSFDALEKSADKFDKGIKRITQSGLCV